MTFKEFLKDKRSIKVLAKEMKVKRKSLSSWLLGKTKPSVTIIIKISKTLNLLGYPTNPLEVYNYLNEVRQKERK